MLAISKHQPSANLTAAVSKRRSPSDKMTTAADSGDLPAASAPGIAKVVTSYTWPGALHRDWEQASVSLGAHMHECSEVHKHTPMITKR